MVGGTPSFEFAGPGRILFGPGAARRVPGLAVEFGRRILLVTGGDPGRHQLLQTELAEVASLVRWVRVRTEPTVDWVLETLASSRSADCDVVVACGGGSVLDGGKALAGLLPNPGDVFEYLEVIGAGKPLPVPALPVIAVPTTAGSGSEATRNAVLSAREQGVKASLRHASMLPKVAVVDPELTLDLPPALTAGSGMDALSQLVEPYLSRKRQPLTDGLCEEGMSRVARSLRCAFAQGRDIRARSDLSLAALFSGMALANAGLGAVHGLAAPLGGVLGAPHGPVCAALLGPVMEVNLREIHRSPDAGLLRDRFDRIGCILTGDASSRAEDGVRWVRELTRDLGIPGLAHWGLAADQIAGVVRQSMKASSMKANPIDLDESELTEILRTARFSGACR